MNYLVELFLHTSLPVSREKTCNIVHVVSDATTYSVQSGHSLKIKFLGSARGLLVCNGNCSLLRLWQR